MGTQIYKINLITFLSCDADSSMVHRPLHWQYPVGIMEYPVTVWTGSSYPVDNIVIWYLSLCCIMSPLTMLSHCSRFRSQENVLRSVPCLPTRLVSTFNCNTYLIFMVTKIVTEIWWLPVISEFTCVTTVIRNKENSQKKKPNLYCFVDLLLLLHYLDP